MDYTSFVENSAKEISVLVESPTTEDSVLTLISPLNDLNFVSYHGTRLNWSGQFSSFDIYLDADSTGLHLLASNIITHEISTGILDSGETYYWKVIGHRDNGTSDTSKLYKFSTSSINLVCYKFIPSSDSLLYDTEYDSKRFDTIQTIDCGTTALFVTDFWEGTVAQFPNSSSNIINLISLARKHGIPVYHLLHEGWQQSAVTILPGEFVVDITNYNIHLEDTLAKHNISTIIYAGYGTGECVTISRVNSLNRIAERTPNRLRIILMNDCTESTFVEQDWAINAVETRYYSSTLANLYVEMGYPESSLSVDSKISIPIINPGGALFYLLDSTFGLNIEDFTKYALILVDVWESHSNDGFQTKMKQNTSHSIFPMLKLARNRGMTIVHIPNDLPIDSLCLPLENEYVMKSVGSPDQAKKVLWDYLKSKNISSLIITGNFVNTVQHFPLLDAWGLSWLNNSPTPYPNESAFNTYFIEDCITAFEMPLTVSNETFKKTYLSRATWYQSGFTHKVSKFFHLRSNINKSPQFVTNGSSYSVSEDSSLTIQIKVIDPDSLIGDGFIYKLIAAPEWLSIDSMSGTVFGIPRGQDVGVFYTIVEVHDLFGGSVTRLDTITVLHTNHPPVFVSNPDTIALEDEVYDYTAYAYDQDSLLFNDKIKYRLVIGPYWLTIDSISGVLRGIPNAYSVGDTTVLLEATDGFVTIQQSFELKIVHVNHAPVFLSITDSVAKVDSLYRFQLYAFDKDSFLFNDILRYRLFDGPDWMTIDSVSGVIIGVPSESDIGKHLVIAEAYDRNGSSSEVEWAVTVGRAFRPPTAVALENPTHQDTLTLFKIPLMRTFTWSKANDPDSQDTLLYHFRIYGPGLDTVFHGIKDTRVTFSGILFQENSKYYWTVKVFDGMFTVSSIDTFYFYTTKRFSNQTFEELPKSFELFQNYPNPFNPNTILRFQVPEESDVILNIYNMLGQTIQRIYKERLSAKYYEIDWKAEGKASGIYIIRMEAIGKISGRRYIKSRRILLLK